MSTQTDISVDELYGLFLGESAENGEACTTSMNGADCDREAVFVIRWRADGRVPPEARCGCYRVTHQCLEHGELYMGLEVKPHQVDCSRCGNFMVPFNFDRIRRVA